MKKHYSIFDIVCCAGLCVVVIYLCICCFTVKQETLTENNENYYPTVFIVTDIHNDEVSLKDYNGNIFCFEGVEDWAIGDICSAIMDNNGTQDITDDIIVSTRYSGSLIGEYKNI